MLPIEILYQILEIIIDRYISKLKPKENEFIFSNMNLLYITKKEAIEFNKNIYLETKLIHKYSQVSKIFRRIIFELLIKRHTNSYNTILQRSYAKLMYIFTKFNKDNNFKIKYLDSQCIIYKCNKIVLNRWDNTYKFRWADVTNYSYHIIIHLETPIIDIMQPIYVNITINNLERFRLKLLPYAIKSNKIYWIFTVGFDSSYNTKEEFYRYMKYFDAKIRILNIVRNNVEHNIDKTIVITNFESNLDLENRYKKKEYIKLYSHNKRYISGDIEKEYY